MNDFYTTYELVKDSKPVCDGSLSVVGAFAARTTPLTKGQFSSLLDMKTVQTIDGILELWEKESIRLNFPNRVCAKHGPFNQERHRDGSAWNDCDKCEAEDEARELLRSGKRDVQSIIEDLQAFKQHAHPTEIPRLDAALKLLSEILVSRVAELNGLGSLITE